MAAASAVSLHGRDMKQNFTFDVHCTDQADLQGQCQLRYAEH